MTAQEVDFYVRSCNILALLEFSDSKLSDSLKAMHTFAKTFDVKRVFCSLKRKTGPIGLDFDAPNLSHLPSRYLQSACLRGEY